MGHNIPDFVKEGANLEREFMELQLELTREQRARQDLIRPILFEELGIDPESGELTERGEQRQELQDVLAERQLQAARGELPLPSGLERDIEDQEQQLQAQLREQFGPGFETASPAIERLEQFRERANIAREQARRGELTTAGDLLSQREQRFGRRLEEIMSVAGAGTSPSFGGGGTGFSSEAAGFVQRGQAASAAEDRRTTQGLSAIGGAIGTAFGGPVGGAFGSFVGGALGDVF